MFVKLKRAAVYKGKKFAIGDIISVSDDLGNRMILAGQAERSAKSAFEEQKKAKNESKSGNIGDLEKLTVKELEELAKQKNIELQPKVNYPRLKAGACEVC